MNRQSHFASPSLPFALFGDVVVATRVTMGDKWEVRRVPPTYLIRELRDDTGVTREVWACHRPDAARLTSTQRLDFGHFGPGCVNARCNYIVRDSAGHTYASTVIVRDWGRYPIGQEFYFLETLDGRRFRMVKWPPAGRATLAPTVKVTPGESWQTPAGASYVDLVAGEELISALQKAPTGSRLSSPVIYFARPTRRTSCDADISHVGGSSHAQRRQGRLHG